MATSDLARHILHRPCVGGYTIEGYLVHAYNSLVHRTRTMSDGAAHPPPTLCRWRYDWWLRVTWHDTSSTDPVSVEIRLVATSAGGRHILHRSSGFIRRRCIAFNRIPTDTGSVEEVSYSNQLFVAMRIISR